MGKESSKRSRFQIHLSTAIVLMMVASVMIFGPVEGYMQEREKSNNYWTHFWHAFWYYPIFCALFLFAIGYACEWRINRRNR